MALAHLSRRTPCDAVARGGGLGVPGCSLRVSVVAYSVPPTVKSSLASAPLLFGLTNSIPLSWFCANITTSLKCPWGHQS